jgi:hypothetical protein
MWIHRRGRQTIATAFMKSATWRLVPIVCCVSACSTVGWLLPNHPGEAGLSRKRVVAKYAPDTLVAEDGTRCTPSADKYDSTERGTSTTCYWVVP